MKHKPIMILALCICAAQLCACANVTEKQNVLCISVEQKDSFGENGALNIRTTTLSSDGRFSTGISSGQLQDGAFEKLAKMACKEDFIKVPDAIDTGIMDGHFTHIKIEFDDGSVLRKGGLIAEEFGPKAFRGLYEAINKAVQAGALDPRSTAN